jgi:hypothetical protein
VPVVFLITILAVLVGIFFVATGRGGELAYEHADHAPLDLGPLSATDVALLRPPTAMWGYNMQVTDEALGRIARAMRDRDVTIAYLQDQLASRSPNDSYAESKGGHAHLAVVGPLDEPEAFGQPEAFGEPEAFDEPEAFEEPQAFDEPGAFGEPEVLETPEAPEAFEPVEAAEVAELIPGLRFPQTPLVLKASAAKVPPAPEPDELTEPSETLQDPEADAATQPSEAHDAAQPPEADAAAQPSEADAATQLPEADAPTQPSEARDAAQPPEADAATEPSEAMASHEALGPQGSFDTHDWWAEQQAAARKEAARRQAAATEEQGW